MPYKMLIFNVSCGLCEEQSMFAKKRMTDIICLKGETSNKKNIKLWLYLSLLKEYRSN